MRLFHIVHVDDSPLFSQQLSDSLTTATTVVHSYRNGSLAKGFVEQGKCDVLIVDSSGFEFAAEARQRSLVERIVVLSGSPENAQFCPSLSLRKLDNCRDELKAFLAEAYLEMVEHHLAKGRTRKDVFAELTDDEREKYTGKVLVLSGVPEKVVFAAESLLDAENFIRQLKKKTRCRLVQGPPAVKMRLADLEEV